MRECISLMSGKSRAQIPLGEVSALASDIPIAVLAGHPDQPAPIPCPKSTILTNVHADTKLYRTKVVVAPRCKGTYFATTSQWAARIYTNDCRQRPEVCQWSILIFVVTRGTSCDANVQQPYPAQETLVPQKHKLNPETSSTINISPIGFSVTRNLMGRRVDHSTYVPRLLYHKVFVASTSIT